jgi:hypothetical protein
MPDGGLAVIRAILDAREHPEAERLCHVGKEYPEKAPRLAEWQEGFAVRDCAAERCRRNFPFSIVSVRRGTTKTVVSSKECTIAAWCVAPRSPRRLHLNKPLRLHAGHVGFSVFLQSQ